MDPGSDTPRCIREFPGNFLMHPPWDDKFKIGSLQIIQIWLKKESIRKFPRNSLMDPGAAFQKNKSHFVGEKKSPCGSRGGILSLYKNKSYFLAKKKKKPCGSREGIMSF